MKYYLIILALVAGCSYYKNVDEDSSVFSRTGWSYKSFGRSIASQGMSKLSCVDLMRFFVESGSKRRFRGNLKAAAEVFSNYMKQFPQEKLPVSKINYIVMGEENKETLVLIHGLDSALVTFSNITEELAKNYRVVIYDQRGHGRTSDLGVNFSNEVMARDLKTLLDHLGVEKAHLLGHSMGARTAIKFADLNASMVKTLIIEDMELYSRVPAKVLELEEMEKRMAFSENLREQFENKVFKSRDELKEALEPLYGDEAESLTYRRAKENDDGSMSLFFRPWVSVQYGFQGNVEDFTEALNRLEVPMLVMQANQKRGTALSDEGLEHIKKNTKNVETYYFENAGHTIHRTDRETFMSVLSEFLNKQ